MYVLAERVPRNSTRGLKPCAQPHLGVQSFLNHAPKASLYAQLPVLFRNRLVSGCRQSVFCRALLYGVFRGLADEVSFLDVSFACAGRGKLRELTQCRWGQSHPKDRPSTFKGKLHLYGAKGLLARHHQSNTLRCSR